MREVGASYLVGGLTLFTEREYHRFSPGDLLEMKRGEKSGKVQTAGASSRRRRRPDAPRLVSDPA